MMVLDEKFQTSSIFISKQKSQKVLFQFSIGTNEKQGNNYFIGGYTLELYLFLVLCHNWIKDGNNLPQVDLSSIKDPRSANNAIGQSINIITQSRQSQNASTLQPVSHKSGKTM